MTLIFLHAIVTGPILLTTIYPGEVVLSTIALLTDFGLRDGYVGVMKGVIWSICPDAQIADITHQIAPQNVRQGALALLRTVHYFPKGTVFVAVVDPGVGTARRPIAAQLGDYFFVGPDNGLFSLVQQAAEAAGEPVKFVHADQQTYWLPEISRVFHGRDIFAPVGAHLAAGIPLEKIGTPIHDPTQIREPQPHRLDKGGWHGEVVEVDYFGNLSTNIFMNHLEDMPQVMVRIAGRQIIGLVRTFGDRAPGDLIALWGTDRDLVVSVVNGSAAEILGVSVGAAVEVIPLQKA